MNASETTPHVVSFCSDEQPVADEQPVWDDEPRLRTDILSETLYFPSSPEPDEDEKLASDEPMTIGGPSETCSPFAAQAGSSVASNVEATSSRTRSKRKITEVEDELPEGFFTTLPIIRIKRQKQKEDEAPAPAPVPAGLKRKFSEVRDGRSEGSLSSSSADDESVPQHRSKRRKENQVPAPFGFKRKFIELDDEAEQPEGSRSVLDDDAAVPFHRFKRQKTVQETRSDAEPWPLRDSVNSVHYPHAHQQTVPPALQSFYDDLLTRRKSQLTPIPERRAKPRLSQSEAAARLAQARLGAAGKSARGRRRYDPLRKKVIDSSIIPTGRLSSWPAILDVLYYRKFRSLDRNKYAPLVPTRFSPMRGCTRTEHWLNDVYDMIIRRQFQDQHLRWQYRHHWKNTLRSLCKGKERPGINKKQISYTPNEFCVLSIHIELLKTDESVFHFPPTPKTVPSCNTATTMRPKTATRIATTASPATTATTTTTMRPATTRPAVKAVPTKAKLSEVEKALFRR
ncbi:hypothetical protein BDN70DRAFT_993052 [Pholiota conissans]|uniref:Uncharacterized protein n=1 Tax=Pholiota conissans TaxID=109636 RepID=A0A9P5Z239_9AGAR|nr:hypothetical protein BDN70DRAFT_993052 [Pholiota conissans]